MSKKQLSSLFAKTTTIPPIEERLQQFAQEPSANPEPASSDLPVEDTDSAAGPVKRYQTGAGAATHTTRLEEQIRQLKEAIKDQPAIRIPVDAIDPNPWQPRIKFDPDALKTLASSIAMGGVMAPIAVRKHPDMPGRYQLIAGERRWRATKMAEKTEIPAVLLELSNADTAANALAENLLRENLTDYEISKAMKAMESQFPNKAQMCETFGVSRSQLYRLLSFDKLPFFVKEALEEEPGLFGVKTLDDLLKLFADKLEKELEPVVTPVLNKLIRGRLNQVEFIKEVAKALEPPQSYEASSKSKQVLLRQGKRVGTLVRDADTLSLKLKLSEIPTAQQVEILSYLQGQFNTKL